MQRFLVLFAAIVAVQARSAGISTSSRELAVAGENPWLVHIRKTLQAGGRLETCAGSLIDQRWVLTSASCLQNPVGQFAWLRYNALDTIHPELVTESSRTGNPAPFIVHPYYSSATGQNDIALISINRNVVPTETINTVPLSDDAEIPESARFCGWGVDEDGAPNRRLSCFNVKLEVDGDQIVAYSEDGVSRALEVGAPLVVDGVQIAYLTEPGNGEYAGKFIRPNVAWVRLLTGLDL